MKITTVCGSCKRGTWIGPNGYAYRCGICGGSGRRELRQS